MPSKLDLAEVDWIVVHCTATKPSMDTTAADVDRWHRELGWSGIGYHWLIRRNGLVEPGRPITMQGAHVSGWINCSVGVCLAGGIDESGAPENNFTKAQFNALRDCLRFLRNLCPDAVICGHRDFPRVAKACPCFDVREWWGEI